MIILFYRKYFKYVYSELDAGPATPRINFTLLNSDYLMSETSAGNLSITSH